MLIVCNRIILCLSKVIYICDEEKPFLLQNIREGNQSVNFLMIITKVGSD